jgi:hypothetical protein
VISVLNIRGIVLVPLGRERNRLQMRLALSVPFKDLFEISSGH